MLNSAQTARKSIALTLLVVSVCLCASVVAQSTGFRDSATVTSVPSCPLALFPEVLPGSRDVRLAELDRLAALAESCLNRVDYFAYRGALLVSLGRGEQAIEVLERALLLAPDSPGIQFDYAQALAQGGDRESAGALLSLLISRNDLHPDFRAFLTRQRSELLKPRWRFGFQFSSLFGHETNLNSGPDSRFFTFNSSAGDLVLELEPASQPKRGAGWVNSVSAVGVTDLGAGQAIYVMGDLRSRQSAQKTDYLQSEGALIWRGPRSYLWSAAGPQANLRLGVSQFDFGGRALFRGIRGEAGLETPLETRIGTCQLRSALALEDRRFRESTSNDGQYRGLVAAYHCTYGSQAFTAQVNAGQDRPYGDLRAGGKQARFELGLGWTRDYGPFETQLIGAYSRAKDDQGYSALLANGAVRRQDRFLAKFEFRVPLNPTWQWLTSVEHSRQVSNIDLFDVRNESVYTGLRVRFD